MAPIHRELPLYYSWRKHDCKLAIWILCRKFTTYHREGDCFSGSAGSLCRSCTPNRAYHPIIICARGNAKQPRPAPHIWKMVEAAPSSKVLQKYLHKLANTLDPVVISTALYAEELISERVWEQAQLEGASYDRCLKVLGALVRQVKASPAYFDKFCSILEDQDVTRDLGRELKGNILPGP